jgi:hypothetical protein
MDRSIINSGGIRRNDYNPISTGTTDLSSNPVLNTYVYTGLYYAVPASGYFYAEEGLQTVVLTPKLQLVEYDLTNSLQLLFDVKVMNDLLGRYDISNNTFVDVSSITLNASTFVSNVSVNNIISLGNLTTMYSNYAFYVNDYFGYANGFNSMFSNNTYVITDESNSFTNIDFISLINQKTLNESGIYVNDLSGSITISDVNSYLRDMVLSNAFQNRTGVTNISKGFLPNDLIYIPDGFQVQLNTVITNHNVKQTTSGANHASIIDVSGTVLNRSAFSDTLNQPLFTTNLRIDPNNTYITQNIKIPLLLILKNDVQIGFD